MDLNGNKSSDFFEHAMVIASAIVSYRHISLLLLPNTIQYNTIRRTSLRTNPSYATNSPDEESPLAQLWVSTRSKFSIRRVSSETDVDIAGILRDEVAPDCRNEGEGGKVIG